MQGSGLIFIVMPVGTLLALFVLIALPFAGARGSGDRRSGGRHSRGQESRGQISVQSAAADAFGSDVIGQGRRPQHIAAVHAHVPGVDAVVSGDAARSENIRRITSQPTGGKSTRS
jgi:hypothetical protein